MLRRHFLIPLTLSFAVVMSGAEPALASSQQVISDCNANGHLTSHYSRSDLQGALTGMGADVKEYTNCYDVINRALLAGASGHSGSGGGGGAAGGGFGSGGSGGSGGASGSSSGSGSGVSTRGLYSAPGNAGPAGAGNGGRVPVGGADISPAAASSGSGGSLPAPLIVLFVALALAALTGGGAVVRRRRVLTGD